MGQASMGKASFTSELIAKLTIYYNRALKTYQGNIDKMQNVVLATYNHVTSIDEEPNHGLRSHGKESWCKHNQALAKKKPFPKHSCNLPNYVAGALEPIFIQLSGKTLLECCQWGKTQN